MDASEHPKCTCFYATDGSVLPDGCDMHRSMIYELRDASDAAEDELKEARQMVIDLLLVIRILANMQLRENKDAHL